MGKTEHADCESCPLVDRPFVPSYGPDQADIIIVGEAPGGFEEKEGRPFVGPAGQLLDTVLKHHEIERESCFATNTVLCRPEDNANPSTQAVRACSLRLEQEIKSRRPKKILCLGNFATRQILGIDQGITQARIGPAKESDKYPGVAVVPTFHTAAALYNSSSFPDIVTDVGKLAGTYNPPAWTPPDYLIYETPQEAKEFLTDLLNSRTLEVALDIEIGVDKDLDYEHADHYRLLAIGLCFEPTQSHVIGEEALDNDGVRQLVGRLVEDKRIICHNGKFDLQGLLRFGEGRLYFDTMLASYAMDERGTGIHGLEYQSVERLGSPTWKHVIARYLGKNKNFAAIPRDVLYRYNAFDVANTYRLFLYFDANMPEDLRRLHDHLVEVSNVLQYVERNGIAIDVPYLDELTDHYVELLNRLKDELRGMVNDPLYNPNSWQQVSASVKHVFNRTLKNTRKETIQTLGENAARAGNTALYEFCNTHLQFKKEAKSYGTYVKGTRERLVGGRVYPTYKQHGTVTGRSSSNNPNVQNVTRGSVLRKLFIPGSDSTTFVQADYRQVEFRVICALARDPYLRSVFSDNSRNIHEEVGKGYYGSDFTRDDKERYIRAKAVVFGLSYGREAYSLATEFGINEHEAQRQIDAFFEMIPQVVEWRDDIRRKVLNLEDLVSPYGQHRRFHLITPQNRKDILKECLSFLPQNVAAHTTFASAVEMVKRVPGVRDMLRINVHDSWLLEVDHKDAVEVGRFVAEVMEWTAKDRFTDYVPFPVDVSYGTNWGEMND